MPIHKPNLPTVGGDALTGDGLAVPSASAPLPAGLAATSWLVADLDTGEVLGACGAHRYQIPASVQKVLLAATVLPKLDPAAQVVITTEDVRGWGQQADASSIWMNPGETYSVEELFLGMMLRSGNDAANALARAAGGDRGVPGTLADMNALAHRLGALDSHAATPSGLDPHQLPPELRDDYQVTSAYDQVLIFREAFRNEDFRRYITAPHVTLSAQPHTGRAARTYESLVRFNADYPDALGGKTGFTELARHSFVGARERGGRRLVASVLGAERIPFSNNAYKQAAALMEWGFSVPRGTAVGHLVEPGEVEALVASKKPTAAPLVVVAPPGSGTTPVLLMVTTGAAVVAALGVVTLTRRRRRLATSAAQPAGLPPVNQRPASSGAGAPPGASSGAGAPPRPSNGADAPPDSSSGTDAPPAESGGPPAPESGG
jgi:D-alanyl-D-alanine carboxypeptidase (penicillin-binding protein 5/6)